MKRRISFPQRAAAAAAAAMVLLLTALPLPALCQLTPPDRVIVLDFENEKFETFTRIVAEFSQYNIIAYDRGTKPVTFRSAEIPWSKALDAALLEQGMSKLIDGTVIRIFSRERLSQMIRRPPGFYRGRTISSDLQDTDIDNALRIIEEISQRKIDRTQMPLGKQLTLRLIDVPWDQCLDIIVESIGLKVLPIGENYVLAPAGK